MRTEQRSLERTLSDYSASDGIPRLLDGQRAVVTGAAGDTGQGIVAAFKDAGATVTGLDLHATGDTIICDVTDEAAVAEAFEAAAPTDHVVHAAGVMGVESLAELSVPAFRHVIEVNLIGGFVIAREASRRLPAGGTLTLISSQAGRHGGANWSAYCASKFGLIGMGESLAQELAPEGIRINMVCPGNVDTSANRALKAKLAALRGQSYAEVHSSYLNDIPLGRLGRPADVAGVCLFLASDLASFVVGSSIVVDGGELS